MESQEKSSELIAWRDETWQEVKRLFHEVSHTGKIARYTSYLKVTGVEENPLLPGGWIYELTEPLPMRIYPRRNISINLSDDAMVGVNRQTLSKEEFLKQYGELLSQPTEPHQEPMIYLTEPAITVHHS